MKPFALVLLILTLALPVYSQDAQSGDDIQDAQDFYLLPVLETVFRKGIQWKPNWPSHLPPDPFWIFNLHKQPSVIELSDDNDKFTLRRDSEGRFLEFPCFYFDKYAQVQASYNNDGILRAMTITIKKYASIGEEDSSYSIAFPSNFYPYSDLSPGGSFPPIKVKAGDTEYTVFIFETPSFLTETWYDSNGYMTLYCKAQVEVRKSASRIWWQIRSLQVNNAGGVIFTDFHHDADGNITQINDDKNIFNAIYNKDGLPIFWRSEIQMEEDKSAINQFELQWDFPRNLRVVRAVFVQPEQDEPINAEFRYEYEVNAAGHWIVSRENEMSRYIEGASWKRRLEY
jgi:hypothetical protein